MTTKDRFALTAAEARALRVLAREIPASPRLLLARPAALPGLARRVLDMKARTRKALRARRARLLREAS